MGNETNKNCTHCKHFFITWNPKTPKGCKIYQIQSMEMPSKIIKLASPEGCTAFELKKSKEKPKDPLDLNRSDLW